MQKKNKHLYLVLDDLEDVFSIHKLDAYNDDGDDLSHHTAVLRLRVPSNDMCFSVLGSNILIATDPGCEEAPTLVYDTEIGALAVGPPLPGSLLGHGFRISVAASDTLYALTSYHEHSFEAMSPTAKGNTQDHPWSLSPQEPRTMDWSWKSMPAPPSFKPHEQICSYAMHPVGCTIFFSAQSIRSLSDDLPYHTFSFDTRRCEWRFHEEWVFPFYGEGYYDTTLDAWVGLNDKGYVCASQVPSRRGISRMMQ